jgi:hypothetical protein
MDIIIRDVEEKDGQYKIYNKDGTGGHWYITKESAEVVSSRLEPQVKPVACGHCKDCKYLHTEDATNGEDLHLCDNPGFRLWNLTNCDIDINKFGCTYFVSKPSA